MKNSLMQKVSVIFSNRLSFGYPTSLCVRVSVFYSFTFNSYKLDGNNAMGDACYYN